MIKGNSYPLGSNLNIGRQYEGPNAVMAGLDTERSRAAFRQRVKMRESKATELREYAYKYIYRWTLEEKLSLINTYGEMYLVSNPNNVEEVNNQLVETLLINLNEAELNQIIANVNAQTMELKQKMKTFAKNADARGRMKSNSQALVSSHINMQKTQDYVNDSSTGNIEDNRSSASKSDDNIGRKMAKKDLDFKPSGAMTKLTPILKKELRQILANKPTNEILKIANKIGLDFNAKDRPSDVISDIIYTILVYLNAVAGKSSKLEVVPIPDTAIKVIEGIVAETSAAWIVGKSVISPKILKSLREKAKAKRNEIEEREKLVSIQVKKSKTTNSTEFKKLTGLSGSANSVAAHLDIPENDTGFLKNYSFDDLIAKAAELGIDINPEKQSLGQIKVAIYSKLAEFIKNQQKIQKSLYKSREKDLNKNNGKPSENTKKLESELKAQEKLFSMNGSSVSGKLSSLGSVLYDGNNLLEASGSGAFGVPLLKFEEGKLLSKNITSALPVYIVGKSDAESLYSQFKEDRENKLAEDEKNESMFHLSGSSLTSLMEKISNHKAKDESKKITRKDAKAIEKLNKLKSDAIKQITKYGNLLAKQINKTINKDSTDDAIEKANENLKLFEQVANESILEIKASNNALNIKEILKNYDLKKDVDGISGKKTKSLDVLLKELTSKNKENNKNKNKNNKDDNNDNQEEDQSKYGWGKKSGKGDYLYYNTASKKMLKSFGVDRTKVQPVFITNGFTEYLNDSVELGFQKMYQASNDIYNYLSQSLPILFGGLQSVGTSFNNAAINAFFSKVQTDVGRLTDLALEPFNITDRADVSKYATGGSGKAASQYITKDSNINKAKSNLLNSSLNQNKFNNASKVNKKSDVNYSQFITGDSKTGKVNPELVTVDWNKKQFDVKPANNDGNTVTNKTTMTTKERSSSFNVKFTEGIIHYHKTGETDEGDNIALKVYPVTPGIHDKVNINGESVSVMDLMVGMYSSLASIESLMGTNVELSKVIAAKPVSQVKSSGEVPADSTTFPTNLDGILRGE